jgi:nitrogen fixation/metabolism regulation signal transduction histidine kinase
MKSLGKVKKYQSSLQNKSSIIWLSIVTLYFALVLILLNWEIKSQGPHIIEIIFLLILPGLGVLALLLYLIIRRIQNKPGSRIGLKLALLVMVFTIIPSFVLSVTTLVFVSQQEEKEDVEEKGNLEILEGMNELISKFQQYVLQMKEESEVKQNLEQILIHYSIIDYNPAQMKKIQEDLQSYATTKLDFFMIFKITKIDDINIERTKHIRWLFYTFKSSGKRKLLDQFVNWINTLVDFDEMEESQTDNLDVEHQKNQIIYYFQKLSEEQSVYALGGEFVMDEGLKIMITYVQDIATHLQKVQNRLGFMRQSFQWNILRITVPFILLAILISFIFTQNLIAPIAAMVRGTERVASGNLDYKITARSRDELGFLITSFNTMTDELRFSQNRLFQAEKMAAWREVAKRLAHEVKNPLTPIKLAAERIKRQYKNENPKFASILDTCSKTIESEVDRLRNLVNEFSDFARFPHISPKKVNIIQLIQSIIESYKETHSKVTFEFQYNRLAPEEHLITIDENRMKQVYVNLINNSIEAFPNPAEGRINILIYSKVKNRQIFLVLEMQDNGAGISEENQHQLFTPYFSTKETGTGLGLVITKNIIEEHHGSITCQSVVGNGTTFIIELPC